MTSGSESSATHTSYRGGKPVEIVSGDGVRLRGEFFTGTSQPDVAVVLSHAMLADRRSLDRPAGAGLLSTLRQWGVSVLWLDLRGHGQSDGRDWTYDDLVADAGVAASYLRDLLPEATLVAVGHSLFGHAALAYQAAHVDATGRAVSYDRFAVLGSSVWAERFEPSRRRWIAKRSIARFLDMILPPRGTFPARRLRLGTDESLQFLHQMADWTRLGWSDLSGNSYATVLSQVAVPILSIAGGGDGWLSHPDNQARFIGETVGPSTQITVGRNAGYDFDPGHMDLVLDPRMTPVWEQLADFVVTGILPPVTG
ncbi:MAG: alpha/beta fold hydrolase [Gordonia sp. (in: high G+C Gram-positive bacteria)]